MTEVQGLFIRNLKAGRSFLGLTQTEFAARCGLSQNYVAELESGRRFPSPDTMQRVCDCLRFRPYQLFLSEDDAYGPFSPDEAQRLRADKRSRIEQAVGGLSGGASSEKT